MSQVPDSLPDELRENGADDLLDQLTSICNESTLSRAEILGVLEATKLRLHWGWQVEAERIRDERRRHP